MRPRLDRRRSRLRRFGRGAGRGRARRRTRAASRCATGGGRRRARRDGAARGDARGSSLARPDRRRRHGHERQDHDRALPRVDLPSRTDGRPGSSARSRAPGRLPRRPTSNAPSPRGATRDETPWRWRSRRTRSRCTASTARASPSPSSRTSRATTSTSTGRWSATSRPRRALFTPALSARAVVNADDPHGRLLLDAAEIPTVAFSLADVSDLHLSASASRFTWRGQVITVPIGGRHNVHNALGAATAAVEVGVADPRGRGGHRQRWTGARAVRADRRGAAVQRRRRLRAHSRWPRARARGGS